MSTANSSDQNNNRRYQILSAAFIFVLLAIMLRLEALPLFSTHIIGGTNGDIGIYLYLAKMLPSIGLSSPTWFDLPIMYPYGKVLAWSDNFILPAFIIYLFQKLSLTLIESYNTTILLFSFLNGFLTFVLARSLKRNFIASLWVGVVIQSSSFLSLHLGHPQLQVLFFIPLGILALQISKPFFSGALCVGAFLVALLSGVYIAFFAALTSLVWGVINKRFNSKRCFINFLAGSILAGALTIPFLYPYMEVSKAFGGREISEGFEFAATLKSYISAPALSVLYESTSSFSHPEAQLFMGIGAIGAFVAGLFASGGIPLILFFGAALSLFSFFPLASIIIPLGCFFAKENKISKVVVFLFLLFFSLSLGSIKGETTLHSLASEYLPFISSLRATGRFGLVALFFGAILGSFALSKIHWAVSVILIFAAFFEQRLSAFPLEPYLYTDVKADAPQSTSKKGAVVLPFVNELNEDKKIKSWQDFAKLQLEHINKFGDQEYVLVNGYSGLQGNITQPLARSLSSFPAEVSLHAVKKILGVNTIIANKGVSDPALLSKKEVFDKQEYSLGEISFSSDIVLLAPPWADRAVLVMRSNEPCTVQFLAGEVQIAEKPISAGSQEVVLEFQETKPPVGVRRITLSKNSCNTYWIGHTKVLRGDYVVQ